MQEAHVQSLGWEDFLEKEMATQSSIPTWEIPWTEEPGELWFNSNLTISLLTTREWTFSNQKTLSFE